MSMFSKREPVRRVVVENGEVITYEGRRVVERRPLVVSEELRAEAPVAAPVATGAAAITCPHCGTTGKVTSKKVKTKKGISGGKATGALLTGGVTMLATGLSRKEGSTEMTCGQCRTTWHVS